MALPTNRPDPNQNQFGGIPKAPALQPISPLDASPLPVASPASNDDQDFISLEPNIVVHMDDPETTEEEERRREIAALPEVDKENARRLIARILEEDSTEVLMNGPAEIMFKKAGQRYIDREISFTSIENYHKVINTLILPDTDTTARIGREKYLIEGQLELPDYDDPSRPPLRARVHIVAPPAVQAAKVTIAKKARTQYGVDDLQARGSMSPQMKEFLKALARGRVTVVFSGLSGSGKTTLLEAMSHHFDTNDRVIVIEDTAELHLPLNDVVYLSATTRKPGQIENDIVTMEWLVAQANRMRPERIIVGEVRGAEMAEFLTAANSGAEGSMTTVHANNPRQTIEKISSLAMKSASAKNEPAVLKDIANTIQVIIQMGLIDGKHIITQIEEVSNTVVQSGTSIATAPLFTYDRNTGAFIASGRPSEALTQFLGQRGVRLEQNWFAR